MFEVKTMNHKENSGGGEMKLIDVVGTLDVVAHFAFAGMQRKIVEQRKELNRLTVENRTLWKVVKSKNAEIMELKDEISRLKK